MFKTQKEIEKEFAKFDRQWEKRGFLCMDELKSFLYSLRAADKEAVMETINQYEHDAEAHSKGRCSYSTLALCSAIEQQVKLDLLTHLKDNWIV